MVASVAGRRALATIGLAVVTIVVTGTPAGAITLPPVTVTTGATVGPAAQTVDATSPPAPDPAPSLRTVASERAREFAFPFTLALLVLAFLAVHRRIGAGDARLITAPVDDDPRTFR